MDYNEVWFSRLAFHEKAKNFFYRVFYFWPLIMGLTYDLKY